MWYKRIPKRASTQHVLLQITCTRLVFHGEISYWSFGISSIHQLSETLCISLTRKQFYPNIISPKINQTNMFSNLVDPDTTVIRRYPQKQPCFPGTYPSGIGYYAPTSPTVGKPRHCVLIYYYVSRAEAKSTRKPYMYHLGHKTVV